MSYVVYLLVVTFSPTELPWSPEETDYSRIKAVGLALKKVYNESGRPIRSLPEFEQTAFYPFHESYIPALSNGSLTAAMARDNTGQLRFAGRRSVDRVPIEYPVKTASPQVETRRLVACYTAGVRARRRHIEEIRAHLIASHNDAMRRYQKETGHPPPSFTLRPLPPCAIARNIPRSEVELRRYIRWLQETEGVGKLRDAWGRPLRFSLQRSRLTCQSRGADGVPGTRDDIKASIPVHH